MTLIELKFICPVCRTEKTLPIPKSPIVKGKEDLAKFIIHKGLICDHQFQALIDKDFIVQGYQVVDIIEFDWNNNDDNIFF